MAGGEVGDGPLAEELPRSVYGAADLGDARRRLTGFSEERADPDVPELTRLATTISARRDEVLAYHCTGLSNGPAEPVSLIIEKVRGIGRGLRNPDNLNRPYPRPPATPDRVALG